MALGGGGTMICSTLSGAGRGEGTLQDMAGNRCKSVVVIIAVLAAATLSCSRDEPDQAAAPPAPPPEAELLDFPMDLRAEDPAVNAFITRVIETCAAGDYEAFRLLWSAHDDPFPRDQFYQAWRLVRQVKILALRAFREAKTKEPVYVAQARVELDTSVDEPVRTVIIMLTKEDGQWRLTQPPASLPERLFAPEATSPAPASQPS